MIASLNIRLFAGCHQLGCQPTHFIFSRSLSTSQLKEYYDLLNVTKSATSQEVKESFLKLSKIYHPDNKSTGSHLKFVQLKEAYDALKNGHPTPDAKSSPYHSPYSSSSSSTANPYNPYSNYDRYDEQSYRAHAYQRQRRYAGGQDYSQYYNQRPPGFGGPFADSQTPWEDLKRNREYYQRQQYERLHPAGSALFGTTILLSAIAWMVIYGGLVFMWQGKNGGHEKEPPRQRLSDRRSSSYQDYVEYQRMIKEADIARAARRRRRLQETEVRNAEMRKLEAERTAAEVAAKQIGPVGPSIATKPRRGPESPPTSASASTFAYGEPTFKSARLSVAPSATVVSAAAVASAMKSAQIHDIGQDGPVATSLPYMEPKELDEIYAREAVSFGAPGMRASVIKSPLTDSPAS